MTYEEKRFIAKYTLIKDTPLRVTHNTKQVKSQSRGDTRFFKETVKQIAFLRHK